MPTSLPNEPAYGTPRWMAVRATRALALGIFAMAAVAWVLTPYGVAGGLALGLPVAIMAPRFPHLRVPLLWCVSLAVIGAQLGVLLFVTGTTGDRVLAGLVTTLAVAPWLLILTFVIWARSRS
jgi:hypothetical protein